MHILIKKFYFYYLSYNTGTHYRRISCLVLQKKHSKSSCFYTLCPFTKTKWKSNISCSGDEWFFNNFTFFILWKIFEPKKKMFLHGAHFCKVQGYRPGRKTGSITVVSKVFEFFQPCALSSIKNIFERQVFRIKSYFCYDNSFIQ